MKSRLPSGRMGISLIEVLISVVILGIFSLSFLRTFYFSSGVNKMSETRSNNTMSSINLLETLKSQKGLDSYYGQKFDDGSTNVLTDSNIDMSDFGFKNSDVERLSYKIKTYRGKAKSSDTHTDGVKRLALQCVYKKRAKS